jgi:hypothetical protein
LPATAVPHATVDDAWSVPDTTYDELVAWYRVQLPEGRAWRDWAWCELKVLGEDDGDPLTQWLWSKPPNRILSVIVVEDDPPDVLIGPPDESGPC